MQIGKWAQAFCTNDAQNGVLKDHWVLGILSAIRPDGNAEIMNPIPVGSDSTIKVTNPGPYNCRSVMQIGDWVRGYCTQDAQNGKMRGAPVLGVLAELYRDGRVEIMSPISHPGPYICDQAWPAPDMSGPSAFIKEWRKRLGV